jgi:adenylate cyclase
MDFAAAGLLDDLNGPERRERLHFLERLAAEGFTLEEMVAAAAENRLALLPVERVLAGRYTAAELAERAGVPAALIIHARRVLGLPEADPNDRVFTDEDVAAARSIETFLDSGFSEKAVDDITRVLGEAMARVSAATAAGFTEAFLKPGDTEAEVAWRFADRSQELTAVLDPVLIAAYRAHLRDWVRIGMLSRDELAAGELATELQLAVSFADLVGFTRLGGELEAGELDEVVSTFGHLAARAAGPRVRLVKTIGDAAMFSSVEPDLIVASALDLLEATARAELPSLRVGVAFGTTVPRAGDLYGQAVNLASRVTGVARPGSVLCTEAVRDAAPERFHWSYAGRHRLKGIGDAVPLYRARRLDSAGDDQPGDDG